MAPSQFTVAILPLGSAPFKRAEFTARVLEEEFGVKTIILPTVEIPAQYFNAERGRYQNRSVLNLLFYQLPAEAQRIIGVVAGELEQDANTPCLGCSNLHNKAAAYSVLTLSEWDSLPAKDRVDKALRYYIVVAHEFGHTLGLLHCKQHDCLMYETAHNTKMCAACHKWAAYELKAQLGNAAERFSLAESNFRHNRLPQAITLYRETIRLVPWHEPLYYHCLGVALHKLEQPENGKLNLELAIKHADDFPDFYYTSGLLCLRNRLELAEKYFAKALTVAKNPQKMRRLIGQAYREILHDVERASRHYKEYLQLGGNDQDVIDWLVSRSQL